MFEEPVIIDGHPSIILPSDASGNQIMITVCAECEKMRTVLFLHEDRWFCTNCRNEGVVAPTMVPLTRPRGGRQNG